MVHFNKQIRNLKENFFGEWPSDSQRKNYILTFIFADFIRVSRQKDEWWEIIKENKKVRKQKNALSTKKAIKKKR